MVASASESVVPVAPRPASRAAYRRIALSLIRDPISAVASVVLVLIVSCALAGPYVTSHDPTDQNLLLRLTPPAWAERGSSAHLLGTDNLGRDILSRIIYGARVSVSVGLAVVMIGAVVGTAAGVIAGYFRGRLETVLMGLVDVMLAFPGLLLALMIVAVLGPTLLTVVLALSMRGWVIYARVTRGQTMSIAQCQYIEAARAIGMSDRTILVRHVLPNLLPSIATICVLELARVILAESSLSFLGLGIQPPGISWGLMLADGRNYLLVASWLVTFPGLAIAATVLSVNLLASHARRLLDPYQRGRA